MFGLGAAAGGVLAAVFIVMDLDRPGFVDPGWVDRAVFRVCPFYAVGFTDAFHSLMGVVAFSIAANAILYGALAALLLLGYRLFVHLSSMLRRHK